MSPFAALLAVMPVGPLAMFWIAMFRDMTGNPALSSTERYHWTLAFLFFNVFAAVLYFVQYRNR